MPPFRNVRLLALAALVLGGAALTLGWREGRRYERGAADRTIVFASLGTNDARARTEEAIRLYAAGQFPRACEKFGVATVTTWWSSAAMASTALWTAARSTSPAGRQNRCTTPHPVVGDTGSVTDRHATGRRA